MILKPDGRIDIDHRAYHLRGAPGRSVVVAAAEDGRYSILSFDLKGVHSHHHHSSKIHAVSPDPLGQRLAMVSGDSRELILLGLDGTQLFEIAPSQVKLGFEDCLFDATGNFLWLAAPLNEDEYEVQLIETKTWSLVERATIADPFGKSSCTFFSTERPDLTALWLAAGQDGQQVYWLKRSGNGFSCALEPLLTNTIPPAFSPSGEFYLVANDARAICKYDFHTMRQVGVPVKSGDEDDSFAESLVFLNEQQALASTNEGRLFVVDTQRLEIETEADLEGHETRPIGEYYPTLAKERGLATDISYFLRLGDVVFFVYRRDSGTGLEGWKDTLLWLRVRDELCDTPTAVRGRV